jgi:hypothetical protein
LGFARAEGLCSALRFEKKKRVYFVQARTPHGELGVQTSVRSSKFVVHGTGKMIACDGKPDGIGPDGKSCAA